MTAHLWHVTVHANNVELLTHTPSRMVAGSSIDGLGTDGYSCIVEFQRRWRDGGEGEEWRVVRQQPWAAGMRGIRRHSHFNLASSDH